MTGRVTGFAGGLGGVAVADDAFDELLLFEGGFARVGFGLIGWGGCVYGFRG